MKNRFSFFIVLLFIFPSPATASERPESWFRDQWCRDYHGKSEYALPDKTRCDCLTETHAVEFDFGQKWAEAIGQALFYSLQTGKRAGIVLILRSEKDRKYWIRLNSTIMHFNLPIDTWEINGVK